MLKVKFFLKTGTCKYIIKSKGANNKTRVIATLSRLKNLPESSQTKVDGKNGLNINLKLRPSGLYSLQVARTLALQPFITMTQTIETVLENNK